MDCERTAGHIVRWMADYAASAGVKGFVIGISGGVDSALCSTLAAMTGMDTLCVTLPIHQAASQVDRGREHIAFLCERFPNVRSVESDLTDAYEAVLASFPDEARRSGAYELTTANTRARLRMTALYFHAGVNSMLVVGTGNKVEDFGIGFFTKWGDGGVDMSPIADLTKTQVWELSAFLGIPSSIVSAKPTDGLFGDDRSDEDQIGASYPELEWAMDAVAKGISRDSLSGRQLEVYDIYVRRNRANRHKIDPIPCCRIPEDMLL